MKIITRRQVLQAIESEPLRFGSWIDDESLDDPKCSVCVVGGTLRRAGIVPEKIGLIAGINCIYAVNGSLVAEALADKRYLDALSCYFEGCLNPHAYSCPSKYSDATPDHRARLRKFVLTNFPVKFTIKTK